MEENNLNGSNSSVQQFNFDVLKQLNSVSPGSTIFLSKLPTPTSSGSPLRATPRIAPKPSTTVVVNPHASIRPAAPHSVLQHAVIVPQQNSAPRPNVKVVAVAPPPAKAAVARDVRQQQQQQQQLNAPGFYVNAGGSVPTGVSMPTGSPMMKLIQQPGTGALQLVPSTGSPPNPANVVALNVGGKLIAVDASRLLQTTTGSPTTAPGSKLVIPFNNSSQFVTSSPQQGQQTQQLVLQFQPQQNSANFMQTTLGRDMRQTIQPMNASPATMNHSGDQKTFVIHNPISGRLFPNGQTMAPSPGPTVAAPKLKIDPASDRSSPAKQAAKVNDEALLRRIDTELAALRQQAPRLNDAQKQRYTKLTEIRNIVVTKGSDYLKARLPGQNLLGGPGAVAIGGGVGESPLLQGNSKTGVMMSAAANQSGMRTVNGVPMIITLKQEPVMGQDRKFDLKALSANPMLRQQLTSKDLVRTYFLKDQQMVSHCDTKTPFIAKKDRIKRLLRYHVFQDTPPDEAALTQIDSMFESASQGVLAKAQNMMDRFRVLLLKESMRTDSTAEQVMLLRLLCNEEKQLLQDERQNPEKLMEALRAKMAEEQRQVEEQSAVEAAAAAAESATAEAAAVEAEMLADNTEPELDVMDDSQSMSDSECSLSDSMFRSEYVTDVTDYGSGIKVKLKLKRKLVPDVMTLDEEDVAVDSPQWSAHNPQTDDQEEEDDDEEEDEDEEEDDDDDEELDVVATKRARDENVDDSGVHAHADLDEFAASTGSLLAFTDVATTIGSYDEDLEAIQSLLDL